MLSGKLLPIILEKRHPRNILLTEEFSSNETEVFSFSLRRRSNSLQLSKSYRTVSVCLVPIFLYATFLVSLADIAANDFSIRYLSKENNNNKSRKGSKRNLKQLLISDNFSQLFFSHFFEHLSIFLSSSQSELLKFVVGVDYHHYHHLFKTV